MAIITYDPLEVFGGVCIGPVVCMCFYFSVFGTFLAAN